MNDESYKWKGIIAYLFSFVGGLIIYFTEDRNYTLKFHAMQSTVFGLIVAVLKVLCRAIPFVGRIIFDFVKIIWIIFVVIGAVNAAQNRPYRFPVIGEIADAAEKLIG